MSVLITNTVGPISTTPQDELLGERFNNFLWRKILDDTCTIVDTDNLGLQVISPFGFELLEDKTYLSHRLRRFYAYIGVNKHLKLNKQKIISHFRKILFKKLSIVSPQMWNDIVIVIESDKIIKLKNDNYICKPTDKLIDIQLRVVDTDILTDYANYIITTLAGLHLEKGEGGAFRTNLIWRWRLYQLYIIQEQLFSQLLSPMPAIEDMLYKSIFKFLTNKIQPFFDPNLMHSTLTDQENIIIHGLIKPRIEKMYKCINNLKNDKITIQCQDYHRNENLELTLDKKIYDLAINKIKETYLKFT